MTDACSRRAPFRIVVREVLNLFEDDPQEANATEEVNHEADTFQMTAYPRESSLRTIIGEPDTELQDKQNPPDDEDLFDDSFQVPHTLRRAPAKDNKTSAAKRPTKGAEEDDDIFADIDTQAFHASTNTLVERETKANRENLANERRGARNSRSVSVTSMAVGLMSNKIESGDESHISTNVLSAVRELVREDEGRSGETAAIHNSAPLNIFREVQQSSSPEPSRFLNQLENQVVQSSDLHRVSKTVETPTGRNIDVTKEMNASSGFKTASGKAVNVSARGLEVVKAMFEKEFSNDNSADIPVRLDQPDEQMPDELPNSTAPGHACRALQNVSIGHTGFSTAKGTAINVSAEALERVRRLFQEDFEENKPIISDTVVEKMDSAALAENLGFSTAAGGGVKVNEHLETVRKVLDDDTNSAKPLVSPAQMLAVTQAAIERSKQLPDDAQVTEKPNAVKYPSKTPVRRIAGRYTMTVGF
ncbi:hypothetical protein BIW11_08005 [Tropilaelaps mercedesae]|uniref:Uncharacterized protein n=1 Tax=Tropilaelaps mercedesae TaxID=418985 RepID=A0A1V9XRE9_9ACAR|nr:hypothetical protein BIW11_08005 [Tropilaelaps mercedesae]